MTRILIAAVAGVLGATAAGPARQAGGLKAVAEHRLNVKRSVGALAFHPESKQLAVGEIKVHLFDLTAPEPKADAVLEPTSKLDVGAMTYSRDGKFLIFGGRDDAVRVWNVETKAETALVKAHRGDVYAVATSPDGKFIATGAGDGTTVVWKLGADGGLTELSTLRAGDGSLASIRAAVFHQPLKGERSVITATSYGVIRGYTIGAAPREIGKFRPQLTFYDSRTAPNHDHSLWAINNKEKVYLINSAAAPAGSFGTAAVAHKERVTDLGFSPDGRYLASVSNDGLLVVWDVATKAPRYTTATRPARYTCVAFAPDAPGGVYTLAAGQSDGVVHLMKLAVP